LSNLEIVRDYEEIDVMQFLKDAFWAYTFFWVNLFTLGPREAFFMLLYWSGSDKLASVVLMWLGFLTPFILLWWGLA